MRTSQPTTVSARDVAEGKHSHMLLEVQRDAGAAGSRAASGGGCGRGPQQAAAPRRPLRAHDGSVGSYARGAADGGRAPFPAGRHCGTFWCNCGSLGNKASLVVVAPNGLTAAPSVAVQLQGKLLSLVGAVRSDGRRVVSLGSAAAWAAVRTFVYAAPHEAEVFRPDVEVHYMRNNHR